VAEREKFTETFDC